MALGDGQSLPRTVDQARLFAEADIVIMAHGAALFNTQFIRPYGMLIELGGYHSKPIGSTMIAGTSRVFHCIIDGIPINQTEHNEAVVNPYLENVILTQVPNIADGGQPRLLDGHHLKAFNVSMPRLEQAVRAGVALITRQRRVEDVEW